MVINIQIAHNTTLSRQHETVISPIQWQVLDSIGDHAIQPAYPVTPAHSDLGAPSKVNQTAARHKHAQLALCVSKRWDRFRAVVIECRLRHSVQTFDYKEKPSLAFSRSNLLLNPFHDV